MPGSPHRDNDDEETWRLLNAANDRAAYSPSKSKLLQGGFLSDFSDDDGDDDDDEGDNGANSVGLSYSPHHEPRPGAAMTPSASTPRSAISPPSPPNQAWTPPPGTSPPFSPPPPSSPFSPSPSLLSSPASSPHRPSSSYAGSSPSKLERSRSMSGYGLGPAIPDDELSAMRDLTFSAREAEWARLFQGRLSAAVAALAAVAVVAVVAYELIK